MVNDKGFLAPIFSTSAPSPAGPYSQGIVVAAGTLMFVSGQVGKKPDGELANGVSEQTKQAILNVKAILQAGGFDLADVVKASVYLVDLNDFAVFNRVYSDYFKDVLPARTTVGVSLRAGNLVEIDVIASKSANAG